MISAVDYKVSKPIFIRNARIVDPSQNLDERGSLLIKNGCIAKINTTQDISTPEEVDIIEADGLVAMPGIVDIGVHAGEPGDEHHETFATSSQAAVTGGVTTMITMPDTDPVVDDIAIVDFLRRRSRDNALCRIYPLAAMTKGLMGKAMCEYGLLKEAGAVGFTNGRHTIMNTQVLRNCLTYSRDFDALICHQTQDPYLANSGVMNEGLLATGLGLAGIPREAETTIIERDLWLASMSSARYHASKVSTSASLEAFQRHRDRGIDHISCGVSINNLSLNENDIGSYRTFFKLSPPLRHEDDRLAMVDGLKSGIIDIIVSDHDPQGVEAKRHPFAEAVAGGIGLETLLAATLRLHHDQSVPLIDLVRALSTRPAELLKLDAGTLKAGHPADVTLVNLDEPWIANIDTFHSRSKNTPFEGVSFMGKVKHTIVAGTIVYQDEHS